MNDVLETAFGIVAVVYAGQALLFILALRRPLSTLTSYEPKVSVVVAARNEEHNLPRCLLSLANLDYPVDKLEIIIVDHWSQDNTPEILRTFSRRHDHFVTIRAPTARTTLSGKATAVAAGIEQSSGDIIFLTDADCAVPPTWIRSLLRLFGEEVGAVGGFTALEANPESGGRWFARVQCLDWLFLQSAAAGASALGRPLTWTGNNLAFRRRVYDEVGGYQSVGFSVTEDFALLKTICERTRWAVRFSLDPSSAVLSLPVDSLTELYAQRLRWAVGGRAVHPIGKALITLGVGAHLLAVAAIPLAPIAPLSIILPAAVLVSDLCLLARTSRALELRELLLWVPFFELLFVGYTLAVALSLPFTSIIHWKNIVYRVRQEAYSPTYSTNIQQDRATSPQQPLEVREQA